MPRPKLRRFDDVETTRRNIYRGIKEGFQTAFPREGRSVRLEIDDVQIPEDKRFSKAIQKQHILKDRDLAVPVTGMMTLRDKLSGKVLDRKRMTLGQVPYLTEGRGTFIGSGNEFNPANQMRLRPGAYTRVKQNDEIETQFNVEGKMGFRVNMEPKTGVFRLISKGNKLRLYPILKSMGVSDQQMEKTWGKELADVNRTEEKSSLDRLYKNLAGYNAKNGLTESEKVQHIKEEMKNLRMDKAVNEITLKKGMSHVSPEAFMRSTEKILNVYNGKEDQDDRDSLEFKTFHGVEDFVKERIEKDSGMVGRKLIYQLDKQKKLDGVAPGLFSKQLKQVVRGDDRIYPADQVNPIHHYDVQHKVIVTGEGGVGSMDLITASARNVNPSQFGFVDPIRGPENEKIGIDTRVSLNTYKGDDRTIYSRFKSAKTGRDVYLNPQQVKKAVVAFPHEMEKGRKEVTALRDGKIQYVRKEDVDYYIEKPEEMNSPYMNMIPFASATSGNRTLMAGKAKPDVLPMVEQEAPIVRVATPKGESERDFETLYGSKFLVEKAPEDGEVEKVTPDEIVIKKGRKKYVVDLYNHYPASHKTHLTNIATVKKGDQVKKGQIIAKSNFADEEGTLTDGKHLTTAFMPYKGLTFEDGIVVSESGAKKLTSEQMHKIEVSLDEQTSIGKNKFISQFPTIFGKDKTGMIDGAGVIQKGMKVKKGDPLILATRKKKLSAEDIALGKIHKALKNAEEDVSETWDFDDEGEVVDVAVTGKKAKVYIKTKTPAKIGDKLTGRYGNKGVISAIFPDNEMPKMKRTGERLEMILNPLGIVSRTNPGQVYEGLLGKVGKEKGKIFRTPSFKKGSFVKYTKKIMEEEGIPDQEELVDDQGNETKALVTNPYFYKLSKLSKSVFNARATGGYTGDMQPAKSKRDGNAIKVGTMEIAALLGHGAKANIREMGVVKGQKNDKYWRAMKLGLPLPSVDEPFVYHKFKDMVKASGGNIQKNGDQINISPLTDKETLTMSQGEIKKPSFLKSKNLEPENGGFFDIGITGGVSGKNWSHIKLAEPIPAPIMEKPIRTILGYSQEKFDNVVSGKEQIDGKIGGNAIRDELSKIDVDAEIAREEENIKTAPKSKKDKHIKRLMYLKGIKKTGTDPKDMVIENIPVLPPIYRPISATSGSSDSIVVSDPNLLYRDIMHANNSMKELKKDLDDEDLAEERKTLYDTVAAAVGTKKHVNVEFEKTNVKPFIKKIVGDKPKTGFFFDKMVAKTQDFVGRSVAVPDSTLDLDEIGIPEDMGLKMFQPKIMRKLVQKGYPATQAAEEIKNKSKVAMDTLEELGGKTPVIVNRAPTLHKYNVMAFYPRFHKHKSIATNPMIEAPFNLDHDGDAMQVHIPITEEARIEAIDKMLPSKNLQAIQDHNVHYIPRQEDQYGIYLATKRNSGKKPIKVKDMAELNRLMSENKIKFDDPIEIDEKAFGA